MSPPALSLLTLNIAPDNGSGERRWLAACDAALAAAVTEMPAIVLGDLNVLEPGHWPRYPFFAPFEYDFYRALAEAHRLTDVFRHLHPDAAEYSWAGRAGDGDGYLHQPREDRLSDHSALTMRLAIIPPAPIPPVSLPPA